MKRFLFSFFFILIISVALSACSTNSVDYDTFAQCLSEKGATMYGTEWCSHCKNQKDMFGTSFQFITYVDCDINSDECLKNGVKGYPTWGINDENYPGEQQLPRLASLTGCQLN